MPAASRKTRSVFVCQHCGHPSPKWLGRCPSCEAWSSLVEEVASDPSSKAPPLPVFEAAQPLSAICAGDALRLDTGMDELNRVLGGGLVRGSVILVGGDPGIGKSTLLLQTMGCLAQQGLRVLYVTAEESLRQVKLRAERMGIHTDSLYLLAQTHLEALEAAEQQLHPDVVVVDSIQTIGTLQLESAIGSVGQIRAVTQHLMELSKRKDMATFIVGHVTKEGAIAGPKVMEHMVDTVLYFEGERSGLYRILRAHKNRFGSSQELGIFEMHATGLRPVSNPSALFLSQRAVAPGAVVITSIEGSRALVLEVQALVTPAFYGGTPRRTTTGFDPQRMAMLCAVLSARAGVDLAGSDVFVNVAGGVRINEPAADLGVVLALASAARNTSISSEAVVIGEVGLSGEVRATPHLKARLQEAAMLGFHNALVPQTDLERLPASLPLTVEGMTTVQEALTRCRLVSPLPPRGD